MNIALNVAKAICLTGDGPDLIVVCLNACIAYPKPYDIQNVFFMTLDFPVIFFKFLITVF